MFMHDHETESQMGIKGRSEPKTSFCISHYQGDPSELLECIKGYEYTLYNKSGQSLGEDLDRIAIEIENTGYNLSSYLCYIITNYSDLPYRVAFVKSDIFPRHVSKRFFSELIHSRRDFVPVADYRAWKEIRWPSAFAGHDNMLYEINNSWYRFKHQRKYFYNYNEFLGYFFGINACSAPVYLRFAPGGNYLVSRERILRHSKTFYENLLKIISGIPLACESHYLERSLAMIWDSGVKSIERPLISSSALRELELDCQQKITKDYQWRHHLKSIALRVNHWIGTGC